MRLTKSLRLHPLLFFMLVGLVGTTAGDAFGSPGSDHGEEEPAERRAREKKDRVFVRGADEGSLSNPKLLSEEGTVGALCRALQNPRRAHPAGDEFERGQARHRGMRREAERKVYTAVVGPKGYQLDEYRFEKGMLPLMLDRALVALDGGLLLNIMTHRQLGFELTPAEAAAVAKSASAAQLALRISFRIDTDLGAQYSPCFSYPKSDARTVSGSNRCGSSSSKPGDRGAGIPREPGGGKRGVRVARSETPHLDGPQSLARAGVGVRSRVRRADRGHSQRRYHRDGGHHEAPRDRGVPGRSDGEPCGYGARRICGERQRGRHLG